MFVSNFCFRKKIKIKKWNLQIQLVSNKVCFLGIVGLKYAFRRMDFYAIDEKLLDSIVYVQV